MADNPSVNTNTAAPGATNIPVAGDDIGGAIHQRIKVEFGADGTATEVSAANPLPIVQVGTPALPTGAATETTLAALNTKSPALVSGRVPVDGSGVTQPVSASALPLPAGAATATGVAAIVTALGTPAQAGATQAITDALCEIEVQAILADGTRRSWVRLFDSSKVLITRGLIA